MSRMYCMSNVLVDDAKVEMQETASINLITGRTCNVWPVIRAIRKLNSTLFITPESLLEDIITLPKDVLKTKDFATMEISEVEEIFDSVLKGVKWYRYQIDTGKCYLDDHRDMLTVPPEMQSTITLLTLLKRLPTGIAILQAIDCIWGPEELDKALDKVVSICQANEIQLFLVTYRKETIDWFVNRSGIEDGKLHVALRKDTDNGTEFYTAPLVMNDAKELYNSGVDFRTLQDFVW